MAADETVTYDQVKQILRKRCVTCHNPEEMRGDLDLKDLAAMKMGSSSGDVVIPGDPSKSLLYTTIAHLEDPVMPPNSPPISAREQDLIRRWIASGAAELSGGETPGSGNMPPAASAAAPKSLASSTVATELPGLVAIRSLPQATAVTALDTHPTRDLAAFNGLQQAVLFIPSTGELLGAFDVPGDEVSAVRFSADGQLLLVAAGTPAVSGQVFAFDLSSGQVVWERGDETDTILALDLSPDGKTLAVGGPSKVVRLIDVATGDESRTLKKHTDWVLTIRFSPDGLLLASGDRFGGIIVWEPQAGNLFHNLKDHTDAVHSLAWDAAGETLLSGGEDGLLRTWNMHSGEIESHWSAEVGPISAVARTSEFITAAGRAGRLSTWNGQKSLVRSMDLSQQVESLVPTHNSQWLLAADASGQVSVLQADTLETVHRLRLPSDPQALQQVFARVERAAEDFAAKQQLESQIAATEPVSEGGMSSTGEATVNLDAASARQSTKSLLAAEIENNQRQLRALESSLQASNESLAAMAQASADLSRTLQQLAESQRKLAEQISAQAELLSDCQQRSQELARAIQAAEEGSATNEISALVDE